MTWSATVALNPGNHAAGTVTLVFDYGDGTTFTYTGQHNAGAGGVLGEIETAALAAKANHDQVRTLTAQYVTAIENRMNT